MTVYFYVICIDNQTRTLRVLEQALQQYASNQIRNVAVSFKKIKT